MIIDKIALILTVIGALNWGLVGIFSYDLVAANILGPLLIAFADEIVGYSKKDLVVSGILTELYPEVLAAFTARGFREVSHRSLGEWTTGLLTRQGRF